MVFSGSQNVPSTGIREWIIQSPFSHRIYTRTRIGGTPKYTNKKAISNSDKCCEEGERAVGDDLRITGKRASEEVT